ncbi:unnamed protein product [Aspergillus oryzae]|nr:unnamed protein product [Aspergillus oryzae]GMF94638.1 unnamed protein product [Aspergillus oryzae]
MDGDVKPFLSNTPFTLQQQHHNHHHNQAGWYQPELIPCEWQSLQNKRHRRNLRRVSSDVRRDSDSDSPGATIRWTALRLGQKNLLRTYYEKAFENFQQLNCRAIAKAFVKLVEPRKQVNHPYNGRKTTAGSSQRVDPELTKPKWWPTGVTHREPDHLLKAGLTTEAGGDTIIHVSHVHLAEAGADAELHEPSSSDNTNPLVNLTIKSKRDASNMSECHKPSYESDAHSSTEHSQPARQPLGQIACAPLSPLSTPSISRKSSLESSLTSYSSDLTSSMLSSNEANRVYTSKDVNATAPCIPGYFTQHISTQPPGQNTQPGFWNSIPQAHQSLAFQGY